MGTDGGSMISLAREPEVRATSSYLGPPAACIGGMPIGTATEWHPPQHLLTWKISLGCVTVLSFLRALQCASL